MHDLGSNPAQIIPAWREFVDEHAGHGRPMRGIGEPIWAERSPPEMLECQLHEALLNLAFADGCSMRPALPVRHARSRRGAVIAEAHSEPSRDPVVDGHRALTSDCYHGIDVVSAPFAHPLKRSRPPSTQPCSPFGSDTLDAVRPLPLAPQRAASIVGMDTTRVGDIVLAVNEVATNSVLHGPAARGRCSCGRRAATLICELSDPGGYFDNPLARDANLLRHLAPDQGRRARLAAGQPAVRPGSVAVLRHRDRRAAALTSR